MFGNSHRDSIKTVVISIYVGYIVIFLRTREEYNKWWWWGVGRITEGMEQS